MTGSPKFFPHRVEIIKQSDALMALDDYRAAHPEIAACWTAENDRTLREVMTEPLEFTNDRAWTLDRYRKDAVGTMYAEAAYFPDEAGARAHVRHIADWQDHQRKLRLKRQAQDAIKRRAGR